MAKKSVYIMQLEKKIAEKKALRERINFEIKLLEDMMPKSSSTNEVKNENN